MLGAVRCCLHEKKWRQKTWELARFTNISTLPIDVSWQSTQKNLISNEMEPRLTLKEQGCHAANYDGIKSKEMIQPG